MLKIFYKSDYLTELLQEKKGRKLAPESKTEFCRSVN